MRIKDNFVLQELIDEFIVVPIGDEAERLHGVIRLNSSGAFLWDLLSRGDLTEEDLIKAMTSNYTIDLETAKEDVATFINTIKEFGCI